MKWREERRIRKAANKLKKQRRDCPRCGSMRQCAGCKLGNENSSVTAKKR